MSGLVQGVDTTLYGVASSGGSTSAGVIYSFNTSTNLYTDLYEFVGDSGTNPVGSPDIGSGWKTIWADKRMGRSL